MTVGSASHEAVCHGEVPVIDLIHNAVKISKKYQTWKFEQAADSLNSPGYFTPEQEETLRMKQDDINRIQNVKQRPDEKIARVDASIEFFSNYPEANYSFQAVVDIYSDKALQNLLDKMKEENLRETDPTAPYRLLYEFFKGKEDLENNIKKFINTCFARVAAGKEI